MSFYLAVICHPRYTGDRCRPELCCFDPPSLEWVVVLRGRAGWVNYLKVKCISTNNNKKHVRTGQVAWRVKDLLSHFKDRFHSHSARMKLRAL